MLTSLQFCSYSCGIQAHAESLLSDWREQSSMGSSGLTPARSNSWDLHDSHCNRFFPNAVSLLVPDFLRCTIVYCTYSAARHLMTGRLAVTCQLIGTGGWTYSTTTVQLAVSLSRIDNLPLLWSDIASWTLIVPVVQHTIRLVVHLSVARGCRQRVVDITRHRDRHYQLATSSNLISNPASGKTVLRTPRAGRPTNRCVPQCMELSTGD